MRAVVWLFGCLALAWLAQSMHVWHTMRDGAISLALWVWIFLGLFWASRGAPPRRREWRSPDPEIETLRVAAERAAHKAEQGRGGTTP